MVEATSFVSPKAIPQMSDAGEVLKGIIRQEGVSYPVLVPNAKGMESAIKYGVKEIAVFSAASEAFTQKNIKCTIVIHYYRIINRPSRLPGLKMSSISQKESTSRSEVMCPA